MAPGNLAAKATMPRKRGAVYSVMNSPPPPMARVTAPHSPLAPPVAVVVCSSTESVIQDSWPVSATILSPGSIVISRTGRMVPEILASMAAFLSDSGATVTLLTDPVQQAEGGCARRGEARLQQIA